MSSKWIISGIIWIGAILLLIRMFRYKPPQNVKEISEEEEAAISALAGKLASGEISVEEYERQKKELSKEE